MSVVFTLSSDGESSDTHHLVDDFDLLLEEVVPSLELVITLRTRYLPIMFDVFEDVVASRALHPIRFDIDYWSRSTTSPERRILTIWKTD